MSTAGWTPAEVARIDQLLAQTDHVLDFWVGALREQTAKHGRDQGLANVSLALSMDPRAEQTCQSLLLAALRRLARDHKPGGPAHDW